MKIGGLFDIPLHEVPMLKTTLAYGTIPEVSPEDLNNANPRPLIIDVRQPDEYYGELGHIEGAKLVTMGEELINFLEEQDKDQEIVFICLSGGRSGRVTMAALEMGFKHPINMTGGMALWNELGFPTRND